MTYSTAFQAVVFDGFGLLRFFVPKFVFDSTAKDISSSSQSSSSSMSLAVGITLIFSIKIDFIFVEFATENRFI